MQGNNYICGDLKMQLTVPNGWKITTDTTINGYSILLIGRMNSSTQFAANFNLLLSPYTGSSDMNVILDSAKAAMSLNFPGATTVSSQTVVINNHSVGEFVYNATINGLSLTEKQLYIINNSNLGILTFADLKTNYANSLPSFNSIENSIQFN